MNTVDSWTWKSSEMLCDGILLLQSYFIASSLIFSVSVSWVHCSDVEKIQLLPHQTYQWILICACLDGKSGHCSVSCFPSPSVALSLSSSILNELYKLFQRLLQSISNSVFCWLRWRLTLFGGGGGGGACCQRWGGSDLAVMAGLSWTAGFVLFSIAVFVDVFVQAWGMVQVGAEV
jgi:hypothetical protein